MDLVVAMKVLGYGSLFCFAAVAAETTLLVATVVVAVAEMKALGYGS